MKALWRARRAAIVSGELEGNCRICGAGVVLGKLVDVTTGLLDDVDVRKGCCVVVSSPSASSLRSWTCSVGLGLDGPEGFSVLQSSTSSSSQG